MNNRLLIYFFYDKDGVIDDYVYYILNKINPYIKECIFVSNGEIKEEYKERLPKEYNILIRENKGFDVWAYKDSLDYYGWDNLHKFDEIILMNFTIMGPVDSFDDMFKTMSKQDIDFWGITIFNKVDGDPFGIIEYGYIPTHIQSHFIAVRKSLFTTGKFKEYWDTRPKIKNYGEAVGYHEAIFTKKFEDMGYKWDVYVDTRDIHKYTWYHLMYAPVKLIKEKKCPIFKRKAFILDYVNYISLCNGDVNLELLEYLNSETKYDINMIWDNILRTGNQNDIKNALHLNYILSTDVLKEEDNIIHNERVALMMHIYNFNLIKYCYEYAKNMPEYADIYITTDTEEKAICIEQIFNKLNNKIKVIIIQNRGRDVSALLVGLREYIYNYDLVCFVHDKAVVQLNYEIKGEAFANQCFENTLATYIYIENIINTFHNNPRLGLLTPPPPQFADYYTTLSAKHRGWGDNYKACVELGKKLGLHVNMDYTKYPIAPYGTMFWFRTNALKQLFDIQFAYDDFPKEPIKTDGTILHTIERIYPFVAQENGYYSAWVFTEKFASIQITNLQYMLTGVNNQLYSVIPPNTYYDLINKLKEVVNVINSKSWKITKPLRWVMNKIRKVI